MTTDVLIAPDPKRDQVAADVAGLTVAISELVIAQAAERAADIAVARLGAREGAETWPEWMSVETAASYLDVPEGRIRKLKERGAIPYHQEAPGCRVFFRRSDLDDAMASLRVA